MSYSDLRKHVSVVLRIQFSDFTDDAGEVPADAATCMAILRFLRALFVAIFENRFDTYSADPLDY